jgi:LacI family transcriptional regulator
MAASKEDLKLEEEILKTFMNRQVDGIIIIPSQKDRTDYSVFEQMDRRKIPFVFAVSYYPKHNNDYVMTDYKTGSYRLTKYLIDLGHRKILHLIGSNSESPINRNRLDGYFQAFNEASIHVDENFIVMCRQPDYTSAYEQIKKELAKDKPDAVIAINDIMAIGARKAILEQGYTIPRDISVAGYDDVMFASLMETPLSTVRQDIDEIARRAIELLLAKIKSPSGNANRLLVDAELVIRETTGPKK